MCYLCGIKANLSTIIKTLKTVSSFYLEYKFTSFYLLCLRICLSCFWHCYSSRLTQTLTFEGSLHSSKEVILFRITTYFLSILYIDRIMLETLPDEVIYSTLAHLAFLSDLLGCTKGTRLWIQASKRKEASALQSELWDLTICWVVPTWFTLSNIHFPGILFCIWRIYLLTKANNYNRSVPPVTLIVLVFYRIFHLLELYPGKYWVQ